MRLYQNETYQLIGAAMTIYNHLGPGFLEVIYHDAMEIELTELEIPYESRKPLTVYYRGRRLPHDYIADIICHERILLELKAVKDIHEAHIAQTMNYLKATELALGYVINFGNQQKLQWKRVLVSDNMTEEELSWPEE